MKLNSISMKLEVFGEQPEDAIYLPEIPYSVRLNCKNGGLFVGGNEPENRRSNPSDSIDISILKVSKWFGSLGLAENVLWVQLFYVAGPSVPSQILPPGVVCVSYIKKQSIAALFNKALEVKAQHGEPAKGIFSLRFVKEQGAKGTYYSIGFDWRPRESNEEKDQLIKLGAFMQDFGTQLIDLDGSRAMQCIDGWPAQKVQELIESYRILPEPPALPPTNHSKALTTR